MGCGHVPVQAARCTGVACAVTWLLHVHAVWGRTVLHVCRVCWDACGMLDSHHRSLAAMHCCAALHVCVACACCPVLLVRSLHLLSCTPAPIRMLPVICFSQVSRVACVHFVSCSCPFCSATCKDCRYVMAVHGIPNMYKKLVDVACAVCVCA